jgi:hypothetical protein
MTRRDGDTHSYPLETVGSLIVKAGPHCYCGKYRIRLADAAQQVFEVSYWTEAD